MQHPSVYKLIVSVLLSAALFTAGCSDQQAAEIATSPSVDKAPPKDDIIARVGDEEITFGLLNTMLNSSAIVGLSIPALGTPERDQTRLTLLDKVISANLLYLDAQKQGLDRDPEYLTGLKNFSDGLLIMIYKRRHAGDMIAVTEEEVKAFFDDNMAPGTEWTDEVRMAIESRLRKQRLDSSGGQLRQQVREGVKVSINVSELDPGDDQVRDDSEIVARIDEQPITWGEVKLRLTHPIASKSVESRIAVLDDILDQRIIVSKARTEGLEQDPAYQRAYGEFRKVRLINLHRGRLVEKLQPSDEEVKAYYKENRDTLMVPEQRKLQVVVLETRDDAEAIKQMIESGTITMYQAAQQHSIIPASDKTLGVIGWVSQGSGFEGLDELAFSLGPGEIGGPVETPNGWHLVQVQDMEDAVYDNIDDERTFRMTRRQMIKQRLNDYVVALRQESFPVEVYDTKLSYHMQKEVDWYKIKEETGIQPPEKVQEEIEKLQSGQAPGLKP